MEKKQLKIDQKQVDLYFTDPMLPLVLLIAGEEAAETIYSTDKKTINLLSISLLDWNADLSPWPSPGLFGKSGSFAGNASSFLHWIEQTVKPWAQKMVQCDTVLLVGYSMGGLFALYALYHSTWFTSFCCVSGSVWYPHFFDYCLNEPIKRIPDSIYFSLGTKEIKTRHPDLQKTGKIMEALASFYREKGIDTIFEWNPGTHFTDPAQRIIKAIHWTLAQITKKEGISDF